MDSSRPDPDQLLALLQEEEQQQKRGRLKIFLGYAAGVGKTYAMLEAAHQRKAEGVDVDAILARQPQIVLVDELAHTNVSGGRHPKRYQDVEELLDAGINVYSTLNIQHLERQLLYPTQARLPGLFL
jgi:two-component system sensor histidine kinase KdpD